MFPYVSDNLGSIKDARVSVKPTAKLLTFLQDDENKFDVYNQPVTANLKRLTKKEDVLLSVTDIEWLDSFLKHKRQNSETSECNLFQGDELDKEISKLIKTSDILSKERTALTENKNKVVYLHELIEGCELVLPQNQVIERNPVLAARIKRLRKEQEDREYRAMTRNVDTTKKFIAEDTLSYQSKSSFISVKSLSGKFYSFIICFCF